MSKSQINELVELLNKANDAYYNLDNPIMEDQEYDKLYDQLLHLENKTGYIPKNSPTKNVGYKVISKLNKVQHTVPLLSLNKTKSIDELKQFIGDKECLISLKCDGLTTELDYENGEYDQASTRGDGVIGEDITHNILTVKNVPKRIDYKGKLKIVSESVIHFDDFEEINSRLLDDDKYKTPRNLAAGSVRQLDSKICAERKVNCIVFGLLEVEGMKFKKKHEQFNWLQGLGFRTVPYFIIDKHSDIEEVIDTLKQRATLWNIPIDGLVITYNNTAYSESLGMTSKFPRHSLAFKFTDELSETNYRGLDVQTTRTGIVSLTATFDPVEIDGTEVSRASVHNVDIWKSLQLGIDDTLTVYKANQIIPQISDNLTRSGTEELPTHCPTCQSELEIIQPKDAHFLSCPNPDCKAKLIGKLEHFVSRECMNIVGLSEQTLEKFIERGFIENFTDIYKIEQHANEIKKMDGFGLKSYNKLIDSIDNSRNVSVANFINSLGISKVGLSGAKLLAKHFNNDIEKIIHASERELLKIDGFGEVIIENILNYFRTDSNLEVISELIGYLDFNAEAKAMNNDILKDKVFVITGSTDVFKNRKELQQKIEELGGKVSGSVSAKTNWLINNDNTSNSSKNKAAKELDVPIITEQEFLNMIK